MGLPALINSETFCDDDQLGREITLLSAQMNVGNYRLLKLIAEFDARGAWHCGGTMRSCAHWLAAKCGMTIGAAREKVRVARRLCALPEMEKAFSLGELSYSKVRAITRVATEHNEGFLLMMAERESAGHLEKLVAQYEPVDEFDLGLTNGLGAGGDSLMSSNEANGTDNNMHGSTSSFLEGDIPATELSSEPTTELTTQPATENTTEIDEETRREQARQLYWFQDKDGMWIIHAKLPPEQGQLVVKALEAVARPLQEARQDEWKAVQKEKLQHAARMILAKGKCRRRDVGDVGDGCLSEQNEYGKHERNSAEISTSAPGHEKISAETPRNERIGSKIAAKIPENHRERGKTSGGAPGNEQIHGKISAETLLLQRAQEKISAETFSQFMNQVRADAFTQLSEHFLATSGDYPGFQGLKGAERCQVVLHVDVNTLRQQKSGVCCTHGKAHFEDKPWLSPQTARRLSCDTSLVTVLEDESGKVLNVGRRTRIVPANIRRALRERDCSCRFPGCHESQYVDAHHIKHWADGGETSLENLVTLCRFHHRQLHKGAFNVQVDTKGNKPGLVFS